MNEEVYRHHTITDNRENRRRMREGLSAARDFVQSSSWPPETYPTTTAFGVERLRETGLQGSITTSHHRLDDNAIEQKWFAILLLSSLVAHPGVLAYVRGEAPTRERALAILRESLLSPIEF